MADLSHQVLKLYKFGCDSFLQLESWNLSFAPLIVTGCLVGRVQWEIRQCFKTALEFLESKAFKAQ